MATYKIRRRTTPENLDGTRAMNRACAMSRRDCIYTPAAYNRRVNRPWATIVELPSYEARLKGRLTEGEAEDVKTVIAADPECGDVMKGTGGIRKVRFAVRGKGKSGGVRVVYYFYNETMPVFLLTVFAKSEKDNLTQRERNELAKLVRLLVESY